MRKSGAEKEEEGILSRTERYLHAGADRVAFKSQAMGEHRVGGIFNAGNDVF